MQPMITTSTTAHVDPSLQVDYSERSECQKKVKLQQLAGRVVASRTRMARLTR